MVTSTVSESVQKHMNGDEKNINSCIVVVSCWSFDLLSMTIDDEIDNSADEIDVHNGDLVNQSHRA